MTRAALKQLQEDAAWRQLEEQEKSQNAPKLQAPPSFRNPDRVHRVRPEVPLMAEDFDDDLDRASFKESWLAPRTDPSQSRKKESSVVQLRRLKLESGRPSVTQIEVQDEPSPATGEGVHGTLPAMIARKPPSGPQPLVRSWSQLVVHDGSAAHPALAGHG